MTLSSLDHVNIRTANLAPMSAFYESVLGLSKGPRPPFSFGGAWHYCGGIAAVHLVEVRKAPAGKEPRLEHFAFRAKGMKTFLEKLRQEEITFDIRVVPESGIQQVNVSDPDGNHIEIQFLPEDRAD
jgi:catechol 2,3-dioxygenase-like lactoylglutathione lyase family enzyme